MLDGWYQASGGGLFTAFTYIDEFGKFSCWGLLESQTHAPLSSPKYHAFRDRLTFYGAH
jgi:hypothetical protein